MSLFSKPAFVSLRSLLRDFARFAGRKGVKAFVFMLLGAFVEGIGIVLLIPFFSVIIGGGTGGGRIPTID